MASITKSVFGEKAFTWGANNASAAVRTIGVALSLLPGLTQTIYAAKVVRFESAVILFRPGDGWRCTVSLYDVRYGESWQARASGYTPLEALEGVLTKILDCTLELASKI